LRYCPPGVYMGIDMATVEVLFSETPVASPQVPLADPHPFRVNFYDTTVSTEPNYPDGWAQAVDGNMNRYNYKGFIIPNVLTVVDEYYFHAAPTEYWKHPVEDIKIRISLNAHLWNRDLGFCSISIKNFNTDEWEVLRARVDTHDYKQVLHEFDKDDLEHSDNLYFYINSEEQVEIQIYSENYGCWQGLRYCPPGVYMGIDMATVEVLFSETPDTSPPALSLIEPSGSISGTYTIQPSVRDDETGVSKVEFYEDGALMGTATTPGYSFQWDTTTSTEGSHEVKVIAYNHAGLPREISMKVTVDNVAEKIAAFFWSTDAVTEYGDPGFIMGSYVTYIQRQGYRVYNFPDTTDFYADFHQVADAEGPKDTLFFFFKGHGDYIDGTTMSFSDTYLRAGYRSVISSIEFRELVLTHIETPRLAFLVESCYSGGWVDDFKDLPYLAMSSTDCYHPSVATDVILNFIIFVIYITTFSFMGQFFEGMILGVDARTCFAYASQSYENQNPQMSDNSPYDFF
ncbi:MAG: Ig-like domain-containing protein, partial [Promethearchaeota archaeon]